MRWTVASIIPCIREPSASSRYPVRLPLPSLLCVRRLPRPGRGDSCGEIFCLLSFVFCLLSFVFCLLSFCLLRVSQRLCVILFGPSPSDLCYSPFSISVTLWRNLSFDFQLSTVNFFSASPSPAPPAFAANPPATISKTPGPPTISRRSGTSRNNSSHSKRT